MEDKWIDVSVPIAIATWPGNPLYIETRVNKHGCTNSIINCSAHQGTHIDAPLHWIKQGHTADSIDLNTLIGQVQVIDLTSSDGPIASDALWTVYCSHVWLKTGYKHAKTGDPFNEEYRYLTPDAAKYLAECGVRMIGTDAPSIEKFNVETGGTHKQLLEANIVIVESLDLSAIKDGLYEMIVLPIKVEAEAAWARAIVKPIST